MAISPEAELPVESQAGAGSGGGLAHGLGGMGSMVGSLYSGTAANIYSSLSAGLNMDQASPSAQDNATSALGAAYTRTPGIIRVADVLKVPVPMKNASNENFYALNERIVAAESCWFVAKVRR